MIAASGGTDVTVIGVMLSIFIPVFGAIAIIVWNYFRLQRHRADAVAMAGYRKLAEEAVANQAELRDQIAKLTEHMGAIEQLMRDVG
jgi:heme/copper-type cytochrome/quinol oxidase subunit 2